MLVRALFFDPATGRLVSASYDRSVKVWDLNTGRLITEFKNSHVSHIFDVKFDARRIVRSVIHPPVSLMLQSHSCTVLHTIRRLWCSISPGGWTRPCSFKHRFSWRLDLKNHTHPQEPIPQIQNAYRYSASWSSRLSLSDVYGLIYSRLGYPSLFAVLFVFARLASSFVPLPFPLPSPHLFWFQFLVV